MTTESHPGAPQQKTAFNASLTPSSPTGVASTGIDGLDHILCGGFPCGRIYLVQGDPGVGKTTLALQFLLEGIRAGEKGLYVTLSETEEELKAVAESHQWSLDGIDLFELNAITNHLAADSQNTLFHPAEIELGETAQAIIEIVERSNPTRLVFDSLAELRLMARDPLRYRRQVLALKQYFAKRRCTVLFLDDRTSHEHDLQLQTLAHGVLLLEQLSPNYGSDRRRLKIVKLRGVRFRGGYHDFLIEMSGLVVFPRLIAAEHHRHHLSLELASSGLPELDQMTGGGLHCGTSTLIMGPSGSGKSMLATQYVRSALQRGQRAAVFLFDETLQAFLIRSTAFAPEIEQASASGQLTLQQVDPAELSPGEFVHRVRHLVEVGNVRMVLIDSLNGYLNAMPEEKFLAIQAHELLAYLALKGVVTLLIMAQHGILGEKMESPIDISYLADTVLVLRYFENLGQVRKALSIVKRRTGSHERDIRELGISSSGISLSEPLSGFHGILTGVPSFGG